MNKVAITSGTINAVTTGFACAQDYRTAFGGLLVMVGGMRVLLGTAAVRGSVRCVRVIT